MIVETVAVKDRNMFDDHVGRCNLRAMAWLLPDA